MSELQNPFIGLQSYGPEDSHKLFGRDRDLILMKDRIFSARTTLLFAGSGVGKTSFLSAKIIPDLQAQYRTYYHNRWAGPATPLEAVKKTLAEAIHVPDKDGPLINCFNDFRKNAEPNETGAETGRELREFEETELEASAPDKQCLLILDQFEEIFQYHAYEDYFKRFLNELCEVIRTEDYRVHVVFSMREEFLGELSVFDNLIPDLFNNYYRLKYPDKREATQIIEGTCRIAKAKVHKENLGLLIRDLSKIERGAAAAAERSTQGDNARSHVIERSFIIPPYLQIVCRRQWEKQANAANANQNGFVFLENYEENQAQEMLTEFCHKKLWALSFMEQNVAEQSFDFLVTKQGAKMAYEFNSLVDHMRLTFFKAKLRKALDKLSDPESRILRQSRGPDGSVWFELYHDIYGRILDAWKPLFRRRKQKVALVLTVAMLALFAVIWVWGINPYQYKRILRSVQLETPEGFIKAKEAYQNLSETFGYRGSANSLLAEAWERRAQYSENHNERDAALVGWLQALNVDPNGPRANRWRLKAANLISDDYQRLRQSLRHENDVSTGIFSDDGKVIVTQTNDQRIWIWDSETGKLLDQYSSANFRPDETTPDSARQSPSARPASRVDHSIQPNRQGDTSSRASAPEQLQVETAALHKELGWLVAVSPQKEYDRLEGIYYESDSQGVTHSTIPVSLLSRGGEVLSSAINVEVRVSPRGLFPSSTVAISRDGNLIATTGNGQRTRVWKLDGRKVVPLDGFRTPAFVTDVIFSPDGRWLLFKGEADRLFVWDVASQEPQYPARHINDLSDCKFRVGGNSFVCSASTESDFRLQQWNTATGRREGREIITDPLSELDRSPVLGITVDDRIVLMNFRSRVLRVADIGRGQIGESTRFDIGTDGRLVLSPDGAMALTILENDVRLHTITFEQPSGTVLNAGGTLTEAVLSEDGSRVITVVNRGRPADSVGAKNTSSTIASNTIKIWDVDTLTQIGDSIDDVIAVSDNGEYIAKLERERLPDSSRRNSETPANGFPVQILDARTGAPILRFEHPGDTLFQILVSSPTGRFFATYTGGSSYTFITPEEGDIYLWDTTDLSRPISSSIKIPRAFAATLAFSPDERFFGASGPSSYGVSVWDLQLKKRMHLEKDLPAASMISFNKSGLLIAGASRKVRIWDLATGRQRYNDIETTTRLAAVSISGDGNLVLVGDSDGNVYLWRMDPHSRLGEIRQRYPIHSLTFSDNGQAGIIRAGEWLHTTNVSNNQHLASYFLGPNSLEQCRNVDASGNQFRCLFGFHHGLVKVKNLQSGEITDTVHLDGDAKTVLETWTKRLGLTIDNELGRIVPVVAGALQK